MACWQATSHHFIRGGIELKTESNTYSAGAILDYIPEYTREQLMDLVIHPQHDDTNHRGGVTFNLDYMGVVCNYKVTHTWADLFDLEITSLETGEKLKDNGLYAGDFINYMNVLESAHIEFMTDLNKNWLKDMGVPEEE